MEKGYNQNPHQWGQTHNALSLIIQLAKNRKSKFQDVTKYLMEEQFTYMEKFDGTNIAKDKNGCIYTRRTKLNEYAKDFIGTSLENVKKIDVRSFHELMCDMVGGGVKNTIVFGELMCNHNIHNYIERGVNGLWNVWGSYND